MLVPLPDREAKLYSKLRVSYGDIEFARYCAGVLLKKGWHAKPWERRGTIYWQQAAFTTSLVIAYARPFTRSNGWPDFPQRLLSTYGQDERALHSRLLDLRNTVYAHSDSVSHSIRPWKSGDFTTDIEGAPELRISADDAAMFQAMSEKLLTSLDARIREILATAYRDMPPV